MGEIHNRRIRWGLATLAGLVTLLALVLAAPAGANHAKRPSGSPATAFPGNPTYQGFDPMETSVPYLAWRGEEVRLVKCLTPSGGEIGPRSREILLASQGEWQIMDWSGDAHVWPKFFDDVDQKTNAFEGRAGGDQQGRICWAIDITSHKPGIAIVKLKIDTQDITDADSFLVGEGDPVIAHQFNVIWMTLDQAILRNLNPPGVGPITENPGDENQLGVVVKGAVPLNEEFSTELGEQVPSLDRDEIVLPDAWFDLSRTTLASTSRALRQANDDNPPSEPSHVAGDFWDIHDSTGPYNSTVYGPIAGNPGAGGNPAAGSTAARDFGPGTSLTHGTFHVPQNSTASGGIPSCGGSSTTNDTVDNCLAGELNAFSRVFHDVSGEQTLIGPGVAATEPTIGPFSPTRPDETLLSDSLVNLHDAPMPAALIRFRIDPNTGGADIGGVGFFTEKDKHLEYNRCTPPSDAAHCVTNPFSATYIPPSPTMESNPAELPPPGPLGDDDPDTASGIHGAVGNDFEGYLPVDYAGNQGLYHYWDFVEVLRRTAAPAEFPQECIDQGFVPPGGGLNLIDEIQEVYVYTDEHGEARIRYEAGLRFFPGAFDIDRQQRSCVAEGLIGTARITAQAQYPNQPGTHAGRTSNAVTKNIESLFDKGVVCVEKTADPLQAALCVVFARDFAGRPITQEEVCVLLGLRPSVPEGDIMGVQVLSPYTETRRLDRSACGNLAAITPDESITDLFPVGDDPNTPALDPCGPDEDDLDNYGYLVLKVDARGLLKVTAKFEREHLERSCFFSIPPGGPTPPPPTTITTQVTPPTPPPVTPQVTPPPPPVTPLVTPPPPPPVTPQAVQSTQQTTQVTPTVQTTVRRPATTQRPTTTVKAKKKIKAKKKVKRVQQRRGCVIRGRVVRPCVRGKG